MNFNLDVRLNLTSARPFLTHQQLVSQKHLNGATLSQTIPYNQKNKEQSLAK
jgi:hypothetical protein